MAEPIKLLESQAELYYGKKPEGKLSDYRGIYCGRAGGKSFILTLMGSQALVMGKNIMVFAQDYECLQQNLLNQMKEFFDSWNVDYKVSGKAQQNIIVNVNGRKTTCYGFTYENYKKARGRTKIAMQIYDELAQAPADIFVATAACSRDCGFDPMTLFGSTPLKGTYWDKWVKELIADGYPIVTHGGIYENDHVSDAEIEQMERAFKGMDEQFIRQELYGEIIDGDVKYQVFTSDCFGRTYWDSRGIVSMGIDLAGQGRDNNVFYVVDDVHVLHKYKIQKATTFELNAIARRLIAQFGVRQVVIDMTGGFGQGLYDMLSTMKHIQVIGVNFGQAPKKQKDTEKGHIIERAYLNARAEMYFEAAQKCRDEFSIPKDDNELDEQLRAQQFEITSSGKVKLIEKEAIAGMVGGSPDSSDAFCLALYMRDKYVDPNPEYGGLYEGGLGWGG